MEALPIVQLPDLCLRQIFKCLGLRDLASCRAVCRLFKLYADQVKVHELVVEKPSGRSRQSYWYQTDRPVELDDSISWNAFSSLKPSHLAFDQQLKFLFIHLEIRRVLNFELLNGFKQLVHLETRWSDFDVGGNGRYELTLPNLKVLRLPHFVRGQLLLKTPKLEVLYIYPAREVEFEYPETIKNLNSPYMSLSMLPKFKNLEVFRGKSVEGVLSRDLLSSCKHLRELNLDLNEYIFNSRHYAEFLSSLGHLLAQRASSERGEELKIYFKDALLLDANQLEDSYPRRG